MFSGVHASTRLVHACSAACMSAQGRCTHAEPCAGVHACGPRTQGVRAIRRPAFVARGLGNTRADGRHHQFHEPNRVPGSSEKLHLVKRFTPASDETIMYQFTLKTVPRPRSYGQFAGDTFHATCLVRSIRSIDRANSYDLQLLRSSS